MRPWLWCVLGAALASPVAAQDGAQNGWSVEGLQGSGDPFGALLAHPEGIGFGLGQMPAAPKAPLVYGGCMVAEDGVTPLLCAGGDTIKPPPDGFVWKDDPEASLSEPRHCLWWEEGNTFVGIPGIWLCRDGAAPSGGRPPESLPRPQPDSDAVPQEEEPEQEVF